MILLTQQESDKFAAWLMQEIRDNRRFIEVAAGSPGGEMLKTHKIRECAAYLLVSRNLQSTERVAVKSGEVSEEKATEEKGA